MASDLQLDTATLRELDDLVATGRWSSREQVVGDLVWILHDAAGDSDLAHPPTQRVREAIERGLVDYREGRVRTVDEVRAELRRRYASRR